MKKFIIKLLLFSVPFLVIAIFNYKIDSYCCYSGRRLLDRASDDLLAGKILALYSNIDDRYLQRSIITKMKKNPGTIAVGGSTTMIIKASYLGLDRKNFINHSVPAATLNDLIALLGCYKKKGGIPDTIIIGIDSRMFDERLASDNRWKSIAGEYYHLMPFISENTTKIKLFYDLVKAKISMTKRLLSYHYTILNVETVLKGGVNYRVVQDTSSDGFLKMPDGSIRYPSRLRFQKDAITQEKCKITINQFKKFEKISHMEVFISLIDYIINNGSQIIFFLPPLHPNVYREINKKNLPQTIIKIETMLRSLAQSRGIPVLGSYDPSSFGLSSRDFFDAWHVHEYVVKKIFKSYKRSPQHSL